MMDRADFYFLFVNASSLAELALLQLGEELVIESDASTAQVPLSPEEFEARLAAQFNELVVWILIAAALMSGVLSDWTDTVAILAISFI